MPSTRGDFYKQLVEDAEDEPEEPEVIPQNDVHDSHDLVHDNVEEGRLSHALRRRKKAHRQGKTSIRTV